jgi:hypothetical protein
VAVCFVGEMRREGKGTCREDTVPVVPKPAFDLGSQK